MGKNAWPTASINTLHLGVGGCIFKQRACVGRALRTIQKLGWIGNDGWWEYILPGDSMPLRLHDDDPDLIKHRLREELRKKCLGQLELRRPDTFAGVQNGLIVKHCRTYPVLSLH